MGKRDLYVLQFVKTLSVLLPTVRGREESLSLCMKSYMDNVPNFDIEFVTVRDRLCGNGWQTAAERASGEYLHFSNDDLAVRPGFVEPLVEIANTGNVAAHWFATGGTEYNGRDEGTHDLAELTTAPMPFCTRQTFFEKIGPIPALHYGCDHWFAEECVSHGVKIIGRRHSEVDHGFHETGGIGKWHVSPEGWYGVDMMDFDTQIAYQDYRLGLVPYNVEHPQRFTPEGLARARQWHEQHVC